jgi:DNA-binding NarL/FixJ family response regulator
MARKRSSRVRVLCADDSPDIADLFRSVISAEADLECVGVVYSADGLERLVAAQRPDVLLLDLSMPGNDTLELVRLLARAIPETRVLVFTGHDDPATRDSVADAGAWGLVPKTGDTARVVGAIRAVARGETTFVS